MRAQVQLAGSSIDVQSPVIVVDGYGARLTVERGHLVVIDGFAADGPMREIHFPRGRSKVERLVIRAPAGTISFAALDWCSRMGITIAFVASDSRLINCLIPDNPHDGPVKRIQAISGVTEDGIKLAQWLLERKIEAQLRALEGDFRRLAILDRRESEGERALSEMRDCVAKVASDTTLVGLLMREGLAAQHYWKVLAGTPLPWPEWTKKRIPEHWARIWPRQTGAKALVRDATDPFNAMLNYGYTLLEVETRVACAAYGLDPDLGGLHIDDRLRESFIYDLMEPLRPSVDILALEFVRSHGLRPYMFIELRNGVVRLDPDLARDLAHYVMPKLRKPALALAAAYTARLRHIKVPYVLERPTRQYGLAEKAWDRSKTSARQNCEYCKQPLPRGGLKFCNRHCYLRHAVEVRQPIKLAQQRLEELQAQGISPGHGGQAAKIRGAKLAESNRRRALNLTPEEWRARRAAQERERRRSRASAAELGRLQGAGPSPGQGAKQRGCTELK